MALTGDEIIVLSTIDATDYGFIDVSSNTRLKTLLNKGVAALETYIKTSLTKDGGGGGGEDNNNNDDDPDNGGTNIDPKVYAKLGHFHLLLKNYHQAMSAYQRYYQINYDNYHDLEALYGLGLVYFHFNAYRWSVNYIIFLFHPHHFPIICLTKFPSLSLSFYPYRAIKAFRQILYINPSFYPSNELHIRLGVIFKILCDYDSSLKVSI